MKQGKLWVTLYFSLTTSPSWRRLYIYMSREGIGTNKIPDSRGRPLCSVDGDGFYCTFVFHIGSFSANVWIQHRDIYYLFLKMIGPKALWAAEYNAMCQHDKCKVCQVRNTINPLYSILKEYDTNVHLSCSLTSSNIFKEGSDRLVRAASVLSS